MYVKGDSDGATASQATEQLVSEMAERGLGDVFSDVFDADLSLASVSVSDMSAANATSEPAGVAMATDTPGIAGAQTAVTNDAAPGAEAENTPVDTFSVSLDMEFRQQFETAWVGYRVTFTFQLSTPAPTSSPAPSDGSGAQIPEGPIPVEPDGGIGTGGGDLAPFLDGLQDVMDSLVSDPIEIDPDGTGGNPTELMPGTLTFAPMPVEPDGGIGDGAGPLPTIMAFGPIPVEPNGGIGDGAGPIPGAQSPGGFWVPVGPVTFATGTDQTYGDDAWKRWSFVNDGPTQMGGPDFLAGMPLDLRLSLSIRS